VKIKYGHSRVSAQQNNSIAGKLRHYVIVTKD